MTIRIDLNADPSGNGVDLHGHLETFDHEFEKGGSFFKPNHGSFSDGRFHGSQYELQDESSSTSYKGGFLAGAGEQGELKYYFLSHYVGGNLDTLSFGEGLDKSHKPWTYEHSSVDISGLGLDKDDTRGVMDDLYHGKTAALEEVFDSRGVEINGSTGNDVIGGWANDDVLTGNGGADVFEFSDTSDFGDDTVTDFTDGVDKIDLDYDSVTISSAHGGADTLITTDHGTVILTGVDYYNIDQNDFVG